VTTRIAITPIGRSRSGFRPTPAARFPSLARRRQVALSRRIAEIHDPRKLAPVLQQVLEALARDMSKQLSALGVDLSAVIDLELKEGVLKLKETTTPTALVDHGKVYTKSDNKLYFQDGAGTEHEIQFV